MNREEEDIFDLSSVRSSGVLTSGFDCTVLSAIRHETP